MLNLRLKKNERCPLHGRKDCCGRGGINTRSQRQSRRYILIAPGVRRYDDGREARSDAALKQLKDKKLRTDPTCYACGQQFSDYREVELAHIESKGLGSWKRDDSEKNTVLLHMVTNRDCGSQNLDEYIARMKAEGKKFPCEV